LQLEAKDLALNGMISFIGMCLPIRFRHVFGIDLNENNNII